MLQLKLGIRALKRPRGAQRFCSKHSATKRCKDGASHWKLSKGIIAQWKVDNVLTEKGQLFGNGASQVLVESL